MADPAGRLAHVLEAERDALLSGDFDRVGSLLAEKEAIARDLMVDPVSAERLAPLQDGLRRNQQLFDRALEGLRNVVARVGNMRNARKDLNTYDAQGQRRVLAQPGVPSLERRA